MNKIKNSVTYVLKSIKKDTSLKPILPNLKGKTYIVSGGSRGIGYNIAKKIAIEGGNVIITGKTVTKHPKLEGTVYTAAEDICNIVENASKYILNETDDWFDAMSVKRNLKEIKTYLHNHIYN